MIYFDKAKKILEYDKVLEKISTFARTEGAAELLKNLEPSDSIEEVRRLTAQTAKAREMLTVKSTPSFGRVKNITPITDRAKKNAVLTTRELLDTAVLLRTVSVLKKYPSKNEELGPLEDYFFLLTEQKTLEKNISEAIISEDTIADTASDRLYRIRRDIIKCENSIKTTLDKYTSGSYSKYLQENIVTIRNGRYVVPVRAEHKNDVKGLVHDTSASGATLFIEPMAVLDQNNKLRELKGSEAEEIERILAELTGQVAENADTIDNNYTITTDLAVIFAKAEYSFEMKCMPVRIGESSRIRLKSARHPLLDKEKVVPVNIEFGSDKNILIITGPNTGGKTVTLKTIGLLSMMAQSGLELPCGDGSELPVFKAILPDIGDEQSIEQSLSTFSSHMVNIVSIIDLAAEDTLCLFDELGAGTDPTEGAALAVSILEEIRSKSSTAAATTHYAELKSYAIETEGVVNASCEFDVETLKPTYRIITGMPGKSNAFAISSKLGLSEGIINRARVIMSEENRKFEDIITKLEESESALNKEKEHSVLLRKQAEELMIQAEQIKQRTDEEIKQRLEKAQDQAARMLASAKASSDMIFDEINDLKKKAEKDKNFDDLEKARNAVRESLKSTDITIEPPEKDADYKPPRPFKNGDEVIITGIDKKGYITEIKDNYAFVQAGLIKTRVELGKLRLCQAPKTEQKNSTSSYTRPSGGVRHEIDVRGQTGDDAYFIIDRYLDSAVMARHETVTIIHGKGTGALRAAVWQNLKNDKRVKSFRSGRYGEGDTGVTVIELKI